MSGTKVFSRRHLATAAGILAGEQLRNLGPSNVLSGWQKIPLLSRSRRKRIRAGCVAFSLQRFILVEILHRRNCLTSLLPSHTISCVVQPLPMEHKTETMATASVILVPDDRGLVPIFGIPAIRRLILHVRQLGLEPVYLVGHVNPFRPIVSDLVASDAFFPAEDPAMLDQIVQGLGLPMNGRVLVLRANHVVDRYSLSRFIEAADGQELFRLGGEGKNEPDGIYLVSTVDLVLVLQALWSADSSDVKIPSEPGTTGTPAAFITSRAR